MSDKALLIALVCFLLVLCQCCRSVLFGSIRDSECSIIDNANGTLYTVCIHDDFVRSAHATLMIDNYAVFNNATIPLAIVIVAMAIVVTLMQRNIHRK